VQRILDLLGVRPGDTVLEVGPGSGEVAAAVAALLEGGRVDAIDRSPTAVQRTARRLGESGTARALPLLDLESDAGPYDLVFAVNVNDFWTGDAAPELDAVRRVLASGGSLVLVYDGAAATARSQEIADKIVASLEQYGFAAERLADDPIAVRATPRAGSP
jgi:cyclopropane fatty-acyl-phospholipid synthase-like methyltransferase